jgi:hypothetical protein
MPQFVKEPIFWCIVTTVLGTPGIIRITKRAKGWKKGFWVGLIVIMALFWILYFYFFIRFRAD